MKKASVSDRLDMYIIAKLHDESFYSYLPLKERYAIAERDWRIVQATWKPSAKDRLRLEVASYKPKGEKGKAEAKAKGNTKRKAKWTAKGKAKGTAKGKAKGYGCGKCRTTGGGCARCNGLKFVLKRRSDDKKAAEKRKRLVLTPPPGFEQHVDRSASVSTDNPKASPSQSSIDID